MNRLPSLLCLSASLLFLASATTATSHAQSSSDSEKSLKRAQTRLFALSDLTSGDHPGPVVSLQISGRTYWFLLDTGSSYSFLKESIVKEAKLTISDYPKKIPKSTAKEISPDGKLHVAETPELRINNAKLGFSFIMIPDSKLRMFTDDDYSIAGIIGANLLSHFAVYFDFENKEITFYAKGNLSLTERKEIGFDEEQASAKIAYRGEDGHQYMVDALCNKTKVNLLLDTGAYASKMYKPLTHFDILASAAKPSVTIGFSGEENVLSALASLSFAGKSIIDSPINFSDTKEDYDGLLGMDFLGRYNILMDFPAEKIYFRSIKNR
jgi:predicted aspartyl protease